MKKKKKKLSFTCPIHPDSYMYFGEKIEDKIIGDEYFSVDT